MSKHTPGPWEQSRMLLSPKAKDRRCGFVVNGPDKPDDLPTRICDLRVPQGISGFEEGEANAKLIAAAPELLSALTNLLNWGREHTSPIDPNSPHELLVAAHEAIEKAGGSVPIPKGWEEVEGSSSVAIVDYENNADDFWVEFQHRVSTLDRKSELAHNCLQLLLLDRVEFSDESARIAFEEFVSDIPGFAIGPDHAKRAIIFQ